MGEEKTIFACALLDSQREVGGCCFKVEGEVACMITE